MVNLEERNWNIFTTKHTRKWLGLTTKYGPDRKISQSFQSSRDFSVDDARTKLRQVNEGRRPDGEPEKLVWEFSRSEHSRSDGILYPGSNNYRISFFVSGDFVLRPVLLKRRRVVELFFLRDEIRVSTYLEYINGDLNRLDFIREDCRGIPSKYWSEDVEMVPERSFTGNWEGTSTTMYPNMTFSEPVATKHQWGCWKDHQVYYLPDRVTISCPLKLPEGRESVIVANWQKSDEEMDQMSVLYNESCEFVSQKLDVLKKLD